MTVRNKKRSKAVLTLLAVAAGVAVLGWLAGCGTTGEQPAPTTVASGDTDAVIAARGLTPADVYAAVKTYVPTGKKDEYVMFSSGGHSGQVLVIGVPSMRLLKVIGVYHAGALAGLGLFKRDPRAVLEGGNIGGKQIDVGRHPSPGACRRAGGDYDGQYLFINDKAQARVAVIDLRDFETKQILNNPIATSRSRRHLRDARHRVGDRGRPVRGAAGHELRIARRLRRGIPRHGHLLEVRPRGRPHRRRTTSFALELPPYWQDLCDAGKLVSDGWVFCNSFNTEMATGGIELDNPPFEAGASQRDMDYLHVIN